MSPIARIPKESEPQVLERLKELIALNGKVDHSKRMIKYSVNEIVIASIAKNGENGNIIFCNSDVAKSLEPTGLIFKKPL